MKFRIVHFKTIDSTNTYALLLAREGVAEGTVIISDYQTKGRGRYHRTWVSPRNKDLLCSIVLRPKVRVHETPLLTFVTARAVKEALLAVAKVKGIIRKPNDVVLNGKKVCGILTESHSRSRHLDYVVVGVGINVNSKPQELVRGATSLLAETGRKSSRDTLLSVFLRHFAKHYRAYAKRER